MDDRKSAVPILALVVAFAGVVAPALVQVWNAKQQAHLTEYQVTFQEKRKAYARLTTLLVDQFALSYRGVRDRPDGRIRLLGTDKDLDTFVYDLNEASADLDSFLDEKTRDWLQGEVQALCYLALKAFGQGNTGEEKESARIEYSKRLTALRTRLLGQLFSVSERRSVLPAS